MEIRVKAVPGAKKEYVKELGDGRLEIAVREPAERNLANSRIIDVVATHIGVSSGDVRLISGARSRSKLFSIAKK